jgi:hypothetical protein
MKIDIDNYEEIMFRLLEDDLDESTRIDLLQQIESDELFKFEWESWQKTKFVDPLENYAIESRELTDKIILIADPQISRRKRFFYYWAAAASILLLIGTLFLLTSDFTLRPKQEVAQKVSKSQNSAKTVIASVQNNTVSIAVTDRKQTRNQRIKNKEVSAVIDSITIVPADIMLAEIPKVIDSIPVKTNELAKASEKKSRFTITIETSDISGSDQQNYVMAQREKVKIGKVFTNTKMFLRRKPNGEPDRIILIGDDNNYVCLNLNY